MTCIYKVDRRDVAVLSETSMSNPFKLMFDYKKSEYELTQAGWLKRSDSYIPQIDDGIGLIRVGVCA